MRYSRRLPHKPYTLPFLAVDKNQNLYAGIQERRILRWEKVARAYEANPQRWQSAWFYVDEHPIYWHLREADGPEHERNLVHGYATNRYDVEMTVHRVRPHSHTVGDVEERNTAFAVWAETGPRYWRTDEDWPAGTSHDWELDCGGATFEEAYVNLARKIWEKYGNDRSKARREGSSSGGAGDGGVHDGVPAGS